MADSSGAGEDQQDFPGLNLAYGLVQSAYDSVVTRLNAVEGRIQAVMVFSASFFFTAPLLVAASEAEISLTSPFFYAAGLLALLNLAVGTATRALGTILYQGLNEVRDHWLVLTEDEFKLEAVRWAAIHYESNLRIVNRKGLIGIEMTAVFVLEAILLIYWGLVQLV